MIKPEEITAILNSKSLNIEQISALLPHRYPFLMVDRILEWEADKSITGLKNITGNEGHFPGHFPGMMIMPGVIGLESMAQTTCILAYLSDHNIIGKKFPNFTGLDKVMFRNPVVPGDQLIIKSEIIKKKMGIFRVSAKAFVNDVLSTECIIKATFIDEDVIRKALQR